MLKGSLISAVVLFCFFPLLGQKLTPADHERKLKKLPDSAKVQYLIDNNYALYSADYDHALRLMNEGLAITKSHAWKEQEAYLNTFIGVTLYLKGNYQEALPAYLEAYAIFDSLKNYDGLARLCNELGVFYRRNTDEKTAMEYLRKAQEFALQADNQNQLGTSYAHQAVLLERSGDFEAADELYNKVYRIRLAENDSVGLGYILLDLANIALRNSNLSNALGFIEQSTVIRKRIGDEQGVAVNLVNTGETYFSVGQYAKAITYFEKCLALALRIGYTDLVRYTYEQLSSAHLKLNDYKSAFEYQQKSMVFNDSLYNIEKATVIAELQTKFESEKKAQEIALQQVTLSERDAEIKMTYAVIGGLATSVLLLAAVFILHRSRAKRQQQLLIREKEMSVREAYMMASIQSQENERKRFAQDLHDGMGQLISALRISLMSVNRDSTLEQRVAVVNKAEGLLNEMHREIRSIAFNLMPQTLVQHGLVPALKEMSDRINNSGNITIRISSYDVPERLAEVQEISLYRVIQEWINNVIKYAAASSIEVQLVGHDAEINAIIEDNGEGFDTAILESSAGNGWKNIRSRVNLLRGSVDIDSQPGRPGTTMILRIPLLVRKTGEVRVVTSEQ